MNSQELHVLDGFLNQLTQARVTSKDPQAQAMIADAVASQPDAAYLLVQRAMLLDQALASAKAQITSLQRQLQAAQQAQAANSTSFPDPANAWGNSALPRPTTPQAVVAPAPVAPQASVVGSVASPSPGFFGGAIGSTLGNIATTAAGVAGGAFLFQGIENLLHHNNGNGFLGTSPMGLAAPETTVINNYYGNDTPSLSNAENVPGRDLLDDGLASDGFADNDSTFI